MKNQDMEKTAENEFLFRTEIFQDRANNRLIVGILPVPQTMEHWQAVETFIGDAIREKLEPFVRKVNSERGLAASEKVKA